MVEMNNSSPLGDLIVLAPSSSQPSSQEKLQLFTQPITTAEEEVVLEEGKTTTPIRPTWSFSSPCSSSSDSSSDDSNDDENDDKDITMIWDKASIVLTDNNFHQQQPQDKIVILTHHDDEDDDSGDEFTTSNTCSTNDDAQQVAEAVAVEEKPATITTEILQEDNQHPPVVIQQEEKFSLKEQLKLKFPSSILHHNEESNNTNDNNSTTTAPIITTESTPQQHPTTTKLQQLEEPKQQHNNVVDTNGSSYTDLSNSVATVFTGNNRLGKEEDETLNDETSRRFTFNSTDIIKAVFEGKHDEQVEKLLYHTDVSDYLTQLIKSRNQQQQFNNNNNSNNNNSVAGATSPQSPIIKRMNSTIVPASASSFLSPMPSTTSPIGIVSPSFNNNSNSGSNNSTPTGFSPNLEKLNTIIEKKKVSRSNTTLYNNYTLSPNGETKHRRKITAIGSGMIPNDFNQAAAYSPLSDCGGVDFYASKSDSNLNSSLSSTKRSRSIGANIQSYYKNNHSNNNSSSGSSGSSATSSNNNNSASSSSSDDIYRVTVLGSVGVGKSSVIHKFIKGTFDNEYNSTVFEDIYHKPLMFLKYQEIKLLEILDTSALHIKHYKNKSNQAAASAEDESSPSMEIPSSFLSDYIINCDAYILVYSVDDIQSYKYCKDIYKSIVGQKKLVGLKRTKSNLKSSGNSLMATPRTVARSDIPLVLVGNKSDVGVEERFINPKIVWEDVHTELAFGSNCSFVETSAKKEDVDCVFHALVNRICLREEPKTSSKIQISSSLSGTIPSRKSSYNKHHQQHDPNKKCVIL